MRISVLGAGHAGVATAGVAALHGHQVHLAAISDHPGFVPAIGAAGGILVEAVADDEHVGIMARLDRVDTDVAAAVASADVIVLSLPATARTEYFRLIAEGAGPQTLVFITPDKYGAFALAEQMRLTGRDPDELLIGASDTFLFIAKVHDGHHVWLRGRKRFLHVASHRPARLGELVVRLRELYPEVTGVPSVLHTSLNTSSSSLHPATVLFNMAHIEKRGGAVVDNYDVSPGMGAMIDAIDRERLAVAAAYGVVAQPFPEIWGTYYDLVGTDAYATIRSSPGHRGQILPASTDHRYVSEDVPHGLVPLLELGRLAGIPMPATQAVVTIAETVNGADYGSTGRTLASVGLAGVTFDELRTWTMAWLDEARAA